jgi:broad specificity phosphatase PhoE
MSPLSADPAKRLRFWFIRHGETAWSLSGQHTGRSDIPLNAHGETEARKLGHHLRKIRFSHVLTSPRDAPANWPAWGSRHRSGRTHPNGTTAITKDSFPSTFARNGQAGTYSATVVRTAKRQRNSLADRLIGHLGALIGNVALFSHGQFGAVLATRWIGLAVAHGENLPLDPASLSILSHDPHHPKVRVIELWNAAPASLFTDR